MHPSTSTARTIVHVPRRYVADEWGGTETVIQEIARQQQQTGWDPRVITSAALSRSGQEVLAGIPVHRHGYCYPFFGLSRTQKAAMDKKGGNLVSLQITNALLTQPNVRLFHAHALKRLGGTVRTAARLRRKPYVVSLHGGIYDVPDAERSQMLEPIRGKFEWGRLCGALLGSRRVLEDANHVICVGATEAEMARAQLPHDRVSHLPNGVDCQRFATGYGTAFRAAHGIAQDAFVVLNVSRIDPQKNQLALVEAFAKLHASSPLSRLVLIGPETQPGYADQIRARIHELRLDRVVTLLPGFRNDDPQLVDALHSCDVFVLPSRHEPFGIVVLEAWCAGKAVIASRVGGLRSLITDGEDGLLVPPDSPLDLAAQLRALKNNTPLRQQLGNAGRLTARSRYDWSQIGAQLEEIYQQAEQHAASTLNSTSR